jgi:hypothetical protein
LRRQKQSLRAAMRNARIRYCGHCQLTPARFGHGMDASPLNAERDLKFAFPQMSWPQARGKSALDFALRLHLGQDISEALADNMK